MFEVAVDNSKKPEIAVSRAVAGAGAAAAVIGGFVVWYFDPVKSSLFPACPLYTMTGYACPGCGMTRGLHALLHGDIIGALDYNAMLPLILIFFGYLWLSVLLYALRGRGLAGGKISMAFIWIMLGLLIVFGIVRNLPYYPFNLLFP